MGGGGVGPSDPDSISEKQEVRLRLGKRVLPWSG